MRSSTKKKLFAGFIILTFVMSSIAFVSSIFTGGGLPQQQEFKPLQSFVVEGKIDTKIENVYLQGGFTLLRFYYSNDKLLSFVEQLPYITRTNTEQQQLIVQKIPTNETYVEIVNANADEEIRNVSKENIITSLCRLLTVTPLECITRNVSS